MNVRFLRSPEIYHLQVTIPGSGLVQMHPPLSDSDLTSGFELLTDRGTVYGDYTDYVTVYREMEDGSIILSNDGQVWSPPPPPEPEPESDPLPEPDPIPEPDSLPELDPPTLEELQAAKREEVSAVCEQIIYSGVFVMLSGNLEHFSLTEKDQINLFGKQMQLAAGAEGLEYHQDGHPCRYYTAEEMQTIIEAAMQHVSYHTTYCNSLNMWITGTETVEEVQGIYYGVDVPEKYQSVVLQDYLVKTMGAAREEVKEDGTVV